MNVKDLITALQLMPQDLEVYSICDHGQTPEKASGPQVAYSEETGYTREEWTAYEDEAEEMGYVNKFVIL